MKWAGQDECCWKGARRHFAPLVRVSSSRLFCFGFDILARWFGILRAFLLLHCFHDHSLPSLLCLKLLEPGLHVVQRPVEGVYSVWASEHGKPCGNKELEVGWPGDSRRHLLAIDSSLLWCEWQSTQVISFTIGGAPPSSSVPACQVLASSCTQSKSLSHPPSQDLKLYFVSPIFISPSNWSWKIQVQLQERRRKAETWNSNTILNNKTSFWIHGFKSM